MKKPMFTEKDFDGGGAYCNIKAAAEIANAKVQPLVDENARLKYEMEAINSLANEANQRLANENDKLVLENTRLAEGERTMRAALEEAKSALLIPYAAVRAAVLDKIDAALSGKGDGG